MAFLWSWLYYILAVVVAAVAGVWYMLRRGINRIKPDPIKDIPTPPLTHALLGHPDKMLHPLKHELRLEVRNAARTPVHQVGRALYNTRPCMECLRLSHGLLCVARFISSW